MILTAVNRIQKKIRTYLKKLVELKKDRIVPRDYLPSAYNSVNAAVPLIDFSILRDRLTVEDFAFFS